MLGEVMTRATEYTNHELKRGMGGSCLLDFEWIRMSIRYRIPSR